MGKSKSSTKKEQTKKEQVKKEVDKKEEPVKVSQPEQIPLTPYTGVYMIATLIAAVTAMLSMMMLAKPANYFLQDMIGTAMDESYHFMFSEIMYLELGKSKIYGMYIAVAALSVVAALIAIVGLFKAMKPANKPLIIPNIVAVICTIVAIILFLIEGNYLYEYFDRYGIANEPVFGVYRMLFIMLICNIVGTLVNTIMCFITLKKWKSTGSTGK